MIPKYLKKEFNEILNDLLINEDINENEAYKRMVVIISERAKTIRTETVYFSHARSMAKISGASQELIARLKPADHITKTVIKANKDIRDDVKVIDVTRDIIDKIIALKTSDNAPKLAIYLLFTSGRRSTELVNSIFKLKKGRILLIGKAKGKNKICEFDTIFKPREFLRLQKKFISLLTNKTTFPTLLNRAMKRIIGANFHSHQLRGFYAAYLFKFRNTEKKKINTFISDALCHESIDSSLSYTGYKISFDEPL